MTRRWARIARNEDEVKNKNNTKKKKSIKVKITLKLKRHYGQLLRREEGRKGWGEKGGKNTGERATRDVRLSLTRGEQSARSSRRRGVCARSKEMGEVGVHRADKARKRLEVKSRSNKIEEVKVEVRLALG
ncbi:hypothetical protein PMAC_000466 [Pneumocystis sp. 'macacae']|nr:hypothetical protein PMAC_000466 [Pneumocystis sp. 'macacae']